MTQSHTASRADFASQDSIVRRIWGDADTILFVFAGAAAEFALNRAVDWLFYTGNVPRDPIGRLFSTARFAQDIVFIDEDTAKRTLKRIHAIHVSVENRREQKIPDWANRDVLYMLIDYSERAYQLLHRPLTEYEKDDLYDVFRRVGLGLQIPNLPTSYAVWKIDRQCHLEQDLIFSRYTAELYKQYWRHLGPWRYALLLQFQALLVPEHVRQLLKLVPKPWLKLAIFGYRTLVRLGLRPLVHRVLLPGRYLPEVRKLDHVVAGT